MDPIITSLLDNDLYKLTMMQAFFHKHRDATAKYKFEDRQRHTSHLGKHVAQVREQLDHLCTLKYTDDELKYLESLGYFRPDFLNYLAGYQLKRDIIKVEEGEETRYGGRKIVIEAEGNLLDAMSFEVYVLAIVNEASNGSRNAAPYVINSAKRRLNRKIKDIVKMAPTSQIVEFGTRRRWSHKWQGEVIERMAKGCKHQLMGTSNMHWARTLGLMVYGTMAHEYLQAYQAFVPNLRNFQVTALRDWLDEYGDKLKIALTDTVSLDAFLADLDVDLANVYSGVRIDSGEPVAACEKVIKRYAALGIEPKTKTIMCSDGLDVYSMAEIWMKYHHRCNLVFGIGTSLTNDMGYGTASSVVMKMIECNGKPVGKISDSVGKSHLFNQTHIENLAKAFTETLLEEGKQVLDPIKMVYDQEQ
jgi:nicotinate phosphoribosyltransferase